MTNNNMKKMSGLKKLFNGKKITKAMSMLMVSTMLVSSLAACGKGKSDGQAGAQAQGANAEAKNYDIGPNGDELVTTEAPKGAYSYEVYGVKISMDVKVEDYVTSDSYGKNFDLYKLANDYGWLGKDMYNQPVEEASEDALASEWYTHRDGNMVTRIDLSCYKDELLPGTSNHQFRTLSLQYKTESGDNFYANEDQFVSHRDLFADFGKHYAACDYKVTGPRWSVSYDDIVMICYTFWLASVNPGDNPLVTEFGTDTNSELVKSVDNRTVRYSFP